jgi:Glycosyltransferase family 87
MFAELAGSRSFFALLEESLRYQTESVRDYRHLRAAHRPNLLRAPPAQKARRLRWISFALWGAVLAGVVGRVLFGPPHNDLFATYQAAGRSWLNSEPLYTTFHGFIYTPLVAALFSPLSYLPFGIGAALWRLANTAFFVFAVIWWLKRQLHPHVGLEQFGPVLLLLLPLTIGNINNGQVNLLMIGLLMVAVLSALDERWTLAAFCVALATYFKVYPLAVGLLLAVTFPRPFFWRLLLFLVVLGVVSLLLRNPSYVVEQYQRWWNSRLADPRRYQIEVAPRDLWMLGRALHLPLSEKLYVVIQLASAAGLALLVSIGGSRKWTLDRLLIAILTLGCCWMLLLGPSTESTTYVILGPMLVMALVETHRQKNIGLGPRNLIIASYLIMVVALGINSFLHLKKHVDLMAVQPMGALIFCVGALWWLLGTRYWTSGTGDENSSNDETLSQRAARSMRRSEH